MNLLEHEKDHKQIIDLLYELGNTYLEKEDYDNAIDKFHKLIELGEENSKIYLNLSKAYILNEQFDQKAKEIFEKSLEFEPENPVLNVILSQLYLEANREDEQAIRVYRIALKEDPENAQEIMAKLTKINFQNENIDAARELMHQFVDTPEKISNFLSYYIENEWKHHGFDQVSHYLKQVIDVQEDLSFYRLYVINLLQAEKQLADQFEISLEELNLCKKYITRITSLDHLIDVYLYPSVERFLLKHSIKFNEQTSKPVEEYEIFLADSSNPNMWENALNKKEKATETFVTGIEEIWNKLKSWHEVKDATDRGIESDSHNSNKINKIYDHANTVMVIRLKGVATEDISKDLLNSIAIISNAENTMIQGFKSNDGVILFWNDVNCSLLTAVDFLQKQELKNGLNSEKGQQLQIILHKLSKRDKDKYKTILDDLQMTLSVFQLEREMFLHINQSDPSENGAASQLLVTSSVQQQINGASQFSLEPIELSIQHPSNENSFQVYQVSWNNTLANIKLGEIQNISHFRLLKELHHNQVFTSIKAMDSLLDRLVVIKILLPNFKLDNSKPSLQDQFLQEAKYLGKLNHPNIAMIYDLGKEQEFCFIAREYVEGKPLEVQRLVNQKINWKRTLKICLNIAQTLRFTHEKNIFHCRLQPNNLFLINNNEVKITDFQISACSVPLKSNYKPILKSLRYRAPEQIDNKTIDHRADIFSLGIIMYELFTGNHPFDDTNLNDINSHILKKRPAPVTGLNPDLPEKLNEVIFKAIEKSPKKRYKNMHELERQLAEIIEDLED